MRLVIIACGKSKIWDKHPDAGPTAAKDAYTGSYFRANRRYAEAQGCDWMILSSKFGFMRPDFVIPGNYSVSFKDTSSRPISVQQLRAEVTEQKLARYDEVTVLGGRDYIERVKAAFSATNAKVEAPFAGSAMGQQISMIGAILSGGASAQAAKSNIGISRSSDGVRRPDDAAEIDNFGFLEAEWADVYEAAIKAAAAVYPDPQTACIYARRALDLVVRWVYDHDKTLTRPDQDTLRALINGSTFNATAGEQIVAEANGIVSRGNRAVHSQRQIAQPEALESVCSLFYVSYWVAHTYARTKPLDSAPVFRADALPHASSIRQPAMDRRPRERNETILDRRATPRLVNDKLRLTGVPNAGTFRHALGELFASSTGSYVDVNAGELHDLVGTRSGKDSRMPTCCNVMMAAMNSGDTVLSAPPKGRGTTLTIRYQLPRQTGA